MLDRLTAIPPDPILGISAAYAADHHPNKIDLGIGVYRDENGDTPILESVRKAEQVLDSTQTTKCYLGPRGVVGFNNAISELIFGKQSETLTANRVRTVQTPGGTGALRVAAELVKHANPGARVWASDPTWANHAPVFAAAGLTVESYPYFDRENSSLRFDEMMTALASRAPGDVVVFHACCHNPCGVSPDPHEWESISDLAAANGFLPLIDLAYQGFERGIEEDSQAVRMFARKCPELLVASSCSKNFALYRERVGAVSAVCENSGKASDVETNIHFLTRRNYSMPPSHGTGIVDIILHSEELTALWHDEVTVMRNRINGLRKTLVERIEAAGVEQDFSFLQRQTGMFSFLGLSVDQVRRLRDEFSIYTVDSSRINIASFNESNIDHFVAGLKAVV